jgi:hypothetical protein
VFQPNRQSVVPLNFFQGTFDVGTYTYDLLPGFDYVITSIRGVSSLPDTSSNLQLNVDSLGKFYAVAFGGPDIEQGPPLADEPMIVLRGNTALDMLIATSAAFVSIDGFALAPPTSTFV